MEWLRGEVGDRDAYSTCRGVAIVILQPFPAAGVVQR